MSTNRTITDEQFRDGTTIDGDRLDRAFQGVVDHANQLGPDVLVRRHHANHFVAGYQPNVRAPSNQGTFPWLNSYNDITRVTPGGVLPPGVNIMNPYRVKGQNNPGIDPTLPNFPSQAQYIWTQMQYFSAPVILSSVSLWMVGDTDYLNDFVYGVGIPAHTSGDPVNDILVEVSVSNPAAPEDTVQSSISYHKLRFPATSEASGPLGTPVNTHGDMLPAHPAGPVLAQVAIVDLQRNIPIPRGSRVRISVLIPYYSAGAGAWRAAPEFYMGQTYSLDATFLEATV